MQQSLRQLQNKSCMQDLGLTAEALKYTAKVAHRTRGSDMSAPGSGLARTTQSGNSNMLAARSCMMQGMTWQHSLVQQRVHVLLARPPLLQAHRTQQCQ